MLTLPDNVVCMSLVELCLGNLEGFSDAAMGKLVVIVPNLETLILEGS